MSTTAVPGPSPASAPTSLPPVPGPVLFARYALAPNRLGLCGPEDWRSLEEATREAIATWSGASGAPTTASRRRDTETERLMRHLAADFTGAYPYLRLIAEAHGIADPLDRRIVEAYWVGSRLSDDVPTTALGRHLDTRFRSRVERPDQDWLASRPAAGVSPTHAFHVLDVFPRVGTLRGGVSASEVLDLVDACRISWARVLEVGDDRLEVAVTPLEVRDDRLVLGEPRIGAAQPPLAAGLAPTVAVGDIVSLHWGVVCEVLTPDRLARLVARTRAQLEVTNGAR